MLTFAPFLGDRSEASNASLIGHQNTLATFAANASFGSSSTGLPISASKHVTSTLSNGFRDLGSGPNYAQTGPNGTFDDIGVLSSSGSESLEQVDTNGSGPHQSALLSRIDNIAIPGTSYAHSNDNGVSANQDADFANSQANTCAHCGQQFRRIPDLNRHVKSHDPAKLVHKCSVQGCNYKGSYRKDKLTEHMKKRHGIMSA